MFSHPYISIETKEELDDVALAAWYQSVIKFGPPGIISSKIVDRESQKSLGFFMKVIDDKNIYVVVLSRDLNTDEASKIAQAYNDVQPTGDFVISWSQVSERKEKPKKMSGNVLQAIALEAAKANHTAWLEGKTANGWRYGIKHSRIERTSPFCRDWHNLPETYKMQEYQRMCSLLTVLEKMKLNLTND